MKSRMTRLLTSAILVVATIFSVAITPVAAATPQASEGRLFKETGFRVSNTAFLDFFDKRGGVRTFGYPISREFRFNGVNVQFFQRAIVEQRGDGTVGTLNFLDAGLMPYTSINNTSIPGVDPELQGKTPKPGTPNYGSAIIEYVKSQAPDTWNSLPVKFLSTFLNTVTAKDAFPSGAANAYLLPGFNLELWGAPTSAPQADPTNGNFVYLRFQRGVMHYDRTSGTTQGLLLVEYLKAIMTGVNLPNDLSSAAASSPLYRQYDTSRPGFVARPQDLPNTDLTMAFEVDGATVPSTATAPSSPSVAITDAIQKAFIAEAGPLAQASQKKNGAPASVSLAQAILDTGYGTSELAKTGKNFFGIKGKVKPGPAGVIYIMTWEYINGQWVKMNEPFRAYNTIGESFEDHGLFLRENSRYKPCFETSDPKEFARRLQAAGYATDPDYANKLIRLMDRHNLYQYDAK